MRRHGGRDAHDLRVQVQLRGAVRPVPRGHDLQQRLRQRVRNVQLLVHIPVPGRVQHRQAQVDAVRKEPGLDRHAVGRAGDLRYGRFVRRRGHSHVRTPGGFVFDAVGG